MKSGAVEAPTEPEVDPYGGPDWTPRTAKPECAHRCGPLLEAPTPEVA